MTSSPELYRDFPKVIGRIYEDLVKARHAHHKHDLLLPLAETALVYCASLAFSDYRSRSAAPSQPVESLLDRLRHDRLSFGHALNLFQTSAAAVPDGLFPNTGELAKRRFAAVERLAATMQSIETAIDGLNSSASSSAINVKIYVDRARAIPTRSIKWWAAWAKIVEYRNHIAHFYDHRWPLHNEHYYDLLTPLLHDAIVELLTCPAAIHAVLDHPTADLTLITPISKDVVSHTMCGWSRGIWVEQNIVAKTPVTEIWATDEWPSDTTCLLEPMGSTNYGVRALYWDLHKSPPPPIHVPESTATQAPVRAQSPLRILPSDSILEGRGTAPGTCGEFIQGSLADGTHFHVTCPINKSASTVVELHKAPQFKVDGLRDHQDKLDLALRYTCEFFDLGPMEICVRHWSDLDIGKGMGSSTADVLAGIRSIADALDAPLSPQHQGMLATRVESSDGTMYPGIAVVDHKTGVRLRDWRWYPEFVIAMLVPRDSVETGSISFCGLPELASRYELLLQKFDEAVEERSLADFAALSTQAAALNARFLVNPYAHALTGRLQEFGALGLNIGHTGTVCGLLYPNTPEGRVRASDGCLALRKEFPELQDVKVVTTPRFIDPDARPSR